MKTFILRIMAIAAFAAAGAFPAWAGVVPLTSPFYAGAEQTDERLIYVGGSGTGGRLAIDNHAEFMVARDDANVALNWCNAGTFKWSFGLFGFDGPKSEYPAFEADVAGSPALTFNGGDKMRMILEPGFGYTLPSTITDGVLSVEMWVRNPSVEAGEVLIRFEDSTNVDLTAAQFGMTASTAWQHLVAVSDGSQITFYKNNVEVGTQAGALNFTGEAVINLGAQSFSGSMAALRVHTEPMSAADITHNHSGGVDLGTYLFYVIHETEVDHGWWGDPERSTEDLRWRESEHFRSMWNESENPDSSDDIGARIVNTQLPKAEGVFTYLNEKSGKHLPFVSDHEDKRGDGRKYKWLVGNGWGGSWMGGSPFGLGYGITYAGFLNPHEYVHGTDAHQMGNITGHWWESHANFQVSWLGDPQANPVTACPKHAHVYPSTGGNYYHAYLIWDHLVETPEFGGLYVTRLWNRGPNSGGGDGLTYPPRGMEEMDPSPATPFDEEWVKMAARNITWDYPSHPEYATVWATLKYNTRKHFTLLEEIPYLDAGWYEPPKWRTPQQHGYNIAPLEANPGTVTADLTGFVDAAHGSDWSAMFVAVDGGTPRYGEVFTTAAQGTFDVLAGDDELYLVVVATPDNIMDIGIFANDPLSDYRGEAQDRFPWQVRLTGTTPKASLWQPTPSTAGTISPTAYVAPTAHVAAGAQVLDNARVEGYAQVYGTVRGNAVVSGHAVVESNAVVEENAFVGDYAIIEGGCTVKGAARVLEHAHLMRSVTISDFAVCKGNAEVLGPVHGNGVVDGNYIKTNDVDKGFWFVWSWGSGQHPGELDVDFGGLFVEYEFEVQDDYRVWDTYGATWGRLINGPQYVADHGGTALELDGVDDFVDLHASVATGQDLSFVMDVKWNGGADQSLLEFFNADGDVCRLSPSDAQGKLSFAVTVDGVEQVARADAPLPTGVWTNVKIITYEDTLVILIDEDEVARNDAFTHDVADVLADVCYLGRGASGGYFSGRIDNFVLWSKSLIDVVPPSPDPAEFAVAPLSVTETAVAMSAAQGSDAGGNVEYLFEEATGGAGGDDSGWQSSRRYRDDELDPAVSEYVYRVSMRDGAGNLTDSSPVTLLTWQPQTVFTQNNDADGLAVVEAEDYSRRGEGADGALWEFNTSATGYLGTGTMMVPNTGAQIGEDYDINAPRLDYFVDFAKTGNHWIWVRAHGANPNADSYHLGLDLEAAGWGAYQAWSTHNIYLWMRKGPFTVEEAGVHTVNIWMREDGTRIDRFLVTSNPDYVPTAQTDGQDNVIGDGPAVTGTGTATMLTEGAVTDTTPPTPDPASFASAPAGVSGYTIEMTATAGSDSSGVEYYFEETSGEPGGSNSGWQSSASYSDYQLQPSTSYSYRVRMRDIYGNQTAWSGVETASTTDEIDDQAPTPNPAQFASPPSPDLPQSLTMTAVVGTDVNGPVEYFFEETTGGPGAANSGWQTDPTYTDQDLAISTTYAYTVKMRDGIGNVTDVSPPAAGTTSSDVAPVWFVAEDGDDGNSGTSRDLPFRTINKAFNTAAEGDGIEVAAGNYTRWDMHSGKDVNFIAAGEAVVEGYPIHLGSPDGELARVVFKGPFHFKFLKTGGAYMGGIHVYNSGTKNILFDECTFTFNNLPNIQAPIGLHNNLGDTRLEVRNCTFNGDGSKDGIATSGSTSGAANEFIITDSTFNNCKRGVDLVTPSTDITVSGNAFFDSANESIYVGGQSGIEVTVEGNYVANATGDAVKLDSELRKRVVNNIIEGGSNGFNETRGAGTTEILHNTVVALGGGGASGLRVSNAAAVLKNNVVLGWTTNINAPAGAVQEANVTSADPGFVHQAGGAWAAPASPLGPDAYLPAESSPLIDAGVDAGVTSDYDGASRPRDEGFDIGALEYAPADSNPPEASSTLWILY